MESSQLVSLRAGAEEIVLLIVCKYTCKPCGLKRISVEVPARLTEPVEEWMDATVRLISADHKLRSPLCRASKMSELMIPMTGTDRVGGPTVQ